VSASEKGADPRVRDSPVDLERLKALLGGDQSFLAELCRTFIDSSAALMGEIRAAAAAGDRAAVQSATHKLRGAAAGVCAWRLQELADAAEREVRDIAPGELHTRIDALQAAVNGCTELMRVVAP
jgi:HPt (histidine-containing phosphotransfer) domain-containing protein